MLKYVKVQHSSALKMAACSMTWNKKQLKLSKLIQADHFSLAIAGEFPMSGGVSFQILKKKKTGIPNCPIGRLFEIPVSPAAFPTDFMVKAANQ